MAVINYSDQLKYSGKGYLDSKLAPVQTLDELTSLSAFILAKYYQPGMVVLVMDDGLGNGPSDYVLNEQYEWQKLVKDSIDETRIEELETQTKSLTEKLKEIAGQASTNKADIETLSEKLSKISGIEKIKAGNNISIVEDENGNMVISAEVPEVDFSGVETRIDMLEQAMVSNAEAIEINEASIKTISGDVASLKAINHEAYKTADDNLKTELQKEINVLEERINSISGGEGDVAVDNATIVKNEKKEISVKISQKEGNALIKEEDGLFSQGIFIDGDDADTEIM